MSRAVSERMEIQRVLHHQRHGRIAALPAGKDAEPPGHGFGQQLDLFPLETKVVGDLQIGNPQLDRQGAGDVVVVHVAQFAQHFSQGPPGRGRRPDGLLELGRRDFAGLEEDVA